MASVSFRDVEKNFGTVKVIHGIGFDIADGEFVVLVGPSGCGKSTLLRMLAGLEEISGGEIAIDGHGGQRRRVQGPRHRDGVPELRALSAHDGRREHGLQPEAAQGRPQARLPSASPQAAKILNLDPYLDRFPRELSGGQRQRVAMGRAIVRDPKVFLFDEPLSNLDAKLRVAMRAEIKALHQRLKTTTVYVTHDQIEAMTMADRIVVMQDGSIEQIGTPLELYDRPANLFVAQFIGSPSMNVIPGTLRRSADAAWVEAEGGTRWPLPPGAPGKDGQAVVYGVRPGDLALGGGAQAVPAEVIVVEPTGAETELLVQAGAAQIVVVMHGRTDVQPGQAIGLAVALGNVHLFDPAGGATMRG